MDLRIGARSLWRDRGFTISAVVTLSVGIALSAAVFSVVSGVLMRPLQYANPADIVVINNRPANATTSFVSPAEFFDYRRMSLATTELAYIEAFNANITGGDRPDRVDAVAVSPNFFTLLGVPPLLGRTFNPTDSAAGFTQTAVISYGLWQRLFGGSTGVIGRKTRLDEDDYEIIGVMPRTFAHPIQPPGAPVDIWLAAGFRGAPYPITPVRDGRYGDIIARARPGAGITDIQNDFDRINAELVKTYPAEYGPAGSGWRIVARPLRDVVVGATARPLSLLLGAVGFVLLVACTNVASLLFVRGGARRTEIALRVAIGAGRARIVRALLFENLLLAAVAGTAATILTAGGIGAVRAMVPASMPRRDEIVVDWRVLVFAFICTGLVAITVGVLPALAGARTSLLEVLRAGGHGSTGSGGNRRARRLLVLAEMAMTVVLLAGAGLIARTFWSLQQVDLGFTTNHIMTAEITVSLPNDIRLGKYVASARRAQYFEEILSRLKALPGVDRAAGSDAVPLRDRAVEVPMTVDGHDAVSTPELPRAAIHAVSGEYFATMRTPIVRGRTVTDQDRLGMPLNVVISETAARRLFRGEDPLGRRMKIGPAESTGPWMTVVGIARDAKLGAADAEPGSDLYMSMQQSPPKTLVAIVHTRQDPRVLAQQIADVVHAVDAEQPVYHVEPMQSVVDAALERRRFSASLFIAFAILSLALAAVGVYGLAAQSVTYRRREIALRMAIGADTSAVVRLVVSDALLLAGSGAALGLSVAFLLARSLESQLYGVSARDPLIFVAIAPILLLVSAAASYIPGRAAGRISPVAALRGD